MPPRNRSPTARPCRGCGPSPQRLGIVLVVPIYEAAGNRRYNSAAVIDADGALLGVYRKHHVPTYHSGNYEPFYFHQPVHGFPVFETAFARIGVSICYDRHFPEVARVYGIKGAQLLITPVGDVRSRIGTGLGAGAAGARAGKRVLHRGHQSRERGGAARLGGVFRQELFLRSGRLQILSQGGRGSEEVVLADLDLGEIETVSERWHTARLFQDRRPGTYWEAFGLPHRETGWTPQNKEEFVVTATRRKLRYRPIMTQEMKDAAVAALEDGRLIRSVYDADESDGARFENEVAAYMGTEHAVGVSSGWAAMHVAFLAAGIGPGDEVITVPNSFISVGDVIELVGATPIFVDIDPATFNMDPNRIEAAITPRTKAIMPVHNNGLTCEMGPILEVARRHNLLVIVDSCQTLGSRLSGKQARDARRHRRA